ncbi:hypothetical protein Ac2012v2_007329, partial [Leucoagaricus gongylophorus]
MVLPELLCSSHDKLFYLRLRMASSLSAYNSTRTLSYDPSLPCQHLLPRNGRSTATGSCPGTTLSHEDIPIFVLGQTTWVNGLPGGHDIDIFIRIKHTFATVFILFAFFYISQRKLNYSRLASLIFLSFRLTFRIIDVFTKTKFIGNPLAIVHVPASESVRLSQDQKQFIAREFNLSETVFMYNTPPDALSDIPVKIDIFTTEEELPFAGHPTVGSSWYLLTKSAGKERKQITLRTKAGDIPAILQDSGKVRLQIPVDYKEHKSIELPWFRSAQSDLQIMDYASGIGGKEAVASIVKGMNFVLLKLNSEDALRKLKGVTRRIEVPWLGEWQGLIGLYAFYEDGDGVVRTRMFLETLEDPATGSAASTLAGWLGKRKGPGRWRFEIIQGVEMGRRSDIETHVEIGVDGEVSKVELGGEAVEIMEGFIS